MHYTFQVKWTNTETAFSLKLKLNITETKDDSDHDPSNLQKFINTKTKQKLTDNVDTIFRY